MRLVKQIVPIAMWPVLVTMRVQMLAILQPQDEDKHQQKDNAKERCARQYHDELRQFISRPSDFPSTTGRQTDSHAKTWSNNYAELVPVRNLDGVGIVVTLIDRTLCG
jgi:hypothetical protein